MKDQTDIYVTKPSLPPFDEYVEGLKSIWDSKILTNQGPIHNSFKELLIEYLKVTDMELLVNGHLALEIALQSLGLTGEVITTPFSFASTTHAIVRSGLTPVFADINSEDYNIDVSKIEELITDKTSAILPVHVYGTPCDLEGISVLAEKYNLKVLYDAAHAFGVEVNGKGIGSFGDISMYSFHATKVFTSIEGGGLAFSDEGIKKSIYLGKNFGILNAEEVVLSGTNAKMNEFQALMGVLNLKYVDENIQKRKNFVNQYREQLKEIDGIQLLPDIPQEVKSNYAYFPILVNEKEYGLTRDQLFDLLAGNRIFARKYFYPLITEYSCYKDDYSQEFENANYVADRVVTLPLWGDIGTDVVDFICEVIRNKGE